MEEEHRAHRVTIAPCDDGQCRRAVALKAGRAPLPVDKPAMHKAQPTFGRRVRPGGAPPAADDMNIEHVWPQSLCRTLIDRIDDL